MAYTAWVTRNTGDLITAAIANTYIGDNLTYLKTQTDSLATGLIAEYLDTARTSASNSTSEVTLASVSLAAGWFSDGSNYNNMLLYMYAITMDNNAGGAPTLTVKMKLGSTTVLTPVNGVANTDELRLFVMGTVAASAQSTQHWNGMYDYSQNIATVTYTPSIRYRYEDTSAEDGSGALNFIITAQMDTASASITTYLNYLWLIGPNELNV